MGTTYVYATTNVGDAVGLSLRQLGPDDLSATLDTPSLGGHESRRQVAQVPRSLGLGLFGIDLPFSVAGTYVASLQILVKGHAPGSMIWWRWSAAQAEVGYWLTDHESHSVRVAARGRRYELRVTGKGTFGYDDVDAELVEV